MRSTSSMKVAAFCACLCLAACAGYRGGWESVPYIGDSPPDPSTYRTPFEARQRSELSLPGLNLGVGINNQTRTYDTHVYFFAVPLYLDPRNVRTQPGDPNTTRVHLRVSKTDGDFVFRPRLAKLIVAGKVVSGGEGFEFGMWDASGNRVASGGTYDHRPTAEEHALADGTRTYLLSIDFPVPAPSPERADVALDLSQALQAPGKPAIPLIRFLPTRWKEGYT